MNRRFLSMVLTILLVGFNFQPVSFRAQVTDVFEDFESGTKTAYAVADVTLSTGSWSLAEALIGNLENDKFNDTRSARMKASDTLESSIAMNFDVSNISTVEIYSANYGTETGAYWKLQKSVDSGSSWQDVYTNEIMTDALTKTTVTVNQSGDVRFKIRCLGTATKRINIDDIKLIQATPEATPTPTPTAIVPIEYSGNDDSSIAPNGYTYYKLDTGAEGIHTIKLDSNGNVNPNGCVEIYVVIGKAPGKDYTQVLFWSSSINLYAVIVKGGPKYNLYLYDNNYDEDTNLVSPINASGDPADVSHVSFIFDPALCSVIPTPTPEASPTPTPEASPTPTPEVTPTPTPEVTAAPTVTPTSTPTPVATTTPTPTSAPSSECNETVINHGNPNNPAFSSQGYIILSYAGTGIGGFNGQNGSSTPGNFSPATSGELYGPRGLAVDAAGNLYIADEMNGTVRKVKTNGTMSTITGNGRENGYTPIDYVGPAYGQGMYEPMDVVAGPCGLKIFFLDTDHHIVRMIDEDGNLHTLAGVLEIGSAGSYSNGGGNALQAKFNTPQGIAVDLSGNIYVADTNNNIVRRISPSGTITTIAGQPQIGSFSGDGGQATSATLNRPMGLAFDSEGNLYVADVFNHRIRKINLSTGIITTVAGSGNLPTNSATSEGVGDDGSALQAKLFFPNDIAIDAADNIYIADTQNNRIRKVFSDTNDIITIAGDGYFGNVGNGGAATSARLNTPKGVAVNSDGIVYISDTTNHVVRRLIPN